MGILGKGPCHRSGGPKRASVSKMELYKTGEVDLQKAREEDLGNYRAGSVDSGLSMATSSWVLNIAKDGVSTTALRAHYCVWPSSQWNTFPSYWLEISLKFMWK